jgi:TRAP-type uncharacterized transport system substrate-binding protein
MKKSILLSVLLSLVMTSSFAARQEGAPSADCEGLTIATGPIGKGYSKLYADMAKVSGSQLALCEKQSEGGLDNLNILSKKGADVAIVPMDALKAMSGSNEAVKSLQVVAVLNSNFMHIVVNSNGVTYAGESKYMGLSKGDSKTVLISRFSQLRGATVAVSGSAQLLVSQLNGQLGYGMKIINVNSDVQAFDAVRKGTALAAFSMSGWPSGTIDPLKQDSGLTLATFDAPSSGVYTIKPITYSGIGAYNVQSLSVKNVLVTRPFNGSKTQDVTKLKSIIVSKLDDLKDGKFEPAWNEIGNINQNVDWVMFSGKK